MKTQHLIFLLLFFLLPSTSFAQENPKEKKPTRRRIAKANAVTQIQQLHDGVLFVRLQTRKLAISQLTEMGEIERVEEIKEECKQINLHTMKAFRQEFTFCPVYFFYTDYTLAIKEGRIEDVVFVNDSLLPDTSIKAGESSFLTVEFGNIAQDTAKFVDRTYYKPGEHGPEPHIAMSGGTNMGFGALLIKSDQFVQLRRPFPFYVKQRQRLLPLYPPFRSVKALNRKIARYHRRVTRKLSRR